MKIDKGIVLTLVSTGLSLAAGIAKIMDSAHKDEVKEEKLVQKVMERLSMKKEN